MKNGVKAIILYIANSTELAYPGYYIGIDGVRNALEHTDENGANVFHYAVTGAARNQRRRFL